MAEWKQANMAGFLPEDFHTLISTTQSVMGVVSTVLGVLRGALNAVSSLLVAIPPYDFASALIALVDEFKSSFLGTGFYMANMWDYPVRQYYKGAGTFVTTFESDLISSFTDTSDPNRPTFTGPVALFVLVAGAPALLNMRAVLDNAKAAFAWWTELSAVVARFTRKVSEAEIAELEAAVKRGDIKVSTNPSVQTLHAKKLHAAVANTRDFVSDADFLELILPNIPQLPATPAEVQAFVDKMNLATQTSTYPDWQSASLRTIIPPLVSVFDQALEPLLDGLRAGRDILRALESLVATIDAKVTYLENAASKIEEYVRLLDNLLAATGFYAIFLTSPSGIGGLVQQLRDSTEKPFGDLEGYYSGFAVLAGGPGATPFQALFQPIGS